MADFFFFQNKQHFIYKSLRSPYMDFETHLIHLIEFRYTKIILTFTNFVKANRYHQDKSHNFCICENILYTGTPLYINTINKC